MQDWCVHYLFLISSPSGAQTSGRTLEQIETTFRSWVPRRAAELPPAVLSSGGAVPRVGWQDTVEPYVTLCVT